MGLNRSGLIPRFTPTGVGKTLSTETVPIQGFGSPPRVWGKRFACGFWRRIAAVHPHGCGENDTNMRMVLPKLRFTPTGVGKTVLCRFMMC